MLIAGQPGSGNRNYQHILYNQLLKTDVSEPDKLSSVHKLYNSYGAMLLGFIHEIAGDKDAAEQCLVEVFKDVAGNLEVYSGNGMSVLCSLQILARNKLVNYFKTVKPQNGQAINGRVGTGNNKFLDKMTPEQQYVFCGVHYHGKNNAMLAVELKQPEDAIRKLLKESVNRIRNNR